MRPGLTNLYDVLRFAAESGSIFLEMERIENRCHKDDISDRWRATVGDCMMGTSENPCTRSRLQHDEVLQAFRRSASFRRHALPPCFARVQGIPWTALWIGVVMHFKSGRESIGVYGFRFSSCIVYPLSVLSKLGMSWRAWVFKKLVPAT